MPLRSCGTLLKRLNVLTIIYSFITNLILIHYSLWIYFLSYYVHEYLYFILKISFSFCFQFVLFSICFVFNLFYFQFVLFSICFQFVFNLFFKICNFLIGFSKEICNNFCRQGERSETMPLRSCGTLLKRPNVLTIIYSFITNLILIHYLLCIYLSSYNVHEYLCFHFQNLFFNLFFIFF